MRAYEVLPTSRVQRGRKIEWPVSRRTYHRFTELLQELVDLELQSPEPHVLDRMETLRDDIRHLSGFPRGFDPERDLIVPVVTTAQR